MPNTREKLIALISMVQDNGQRTECTENSIAVWSPSNAELADHLIANGVTVQKWIPASEPPKENGYYLCVVCVSAVNQRKEYRRMILFWEDNVWIEMANCFRTRKPLYWTPLPEPPEELQCQK